MWHFHIYKASLLESSFNIYLEFLKIEFQDKTQVFKSLFVRGLVMWKKIHVKNQVLKTRFPYAEKRHYRA